MSRNRTFLCGLAQRLVTTALALAAPFVSVAANAPTKAFVHANRAVPAGATLGTQTLSLTTNVTAADGNAWYGGEAGFITADTIATVSLAGYTTTWYTYAEKPASGFKEGPGSMTRNLGSTTSLTLTSDIINSLYGRFTNAQWTDLYAVLSPISYTVAYDLSDGSFGESHPTSATYDVPFTVSAPTRTGHAFTGWTCGDKTYYNGETGEVTLSNLTTTAGATVTLAATWEKKSYGLAMVFGEGISKIHYCTNYSSGAPAQNAWFETTSSKTVPVTYGATYAAYAEPAYGYTGSGKGWIQDNPTTGTMTESGATYNPASSVKKATFALSVTASPTKGGSVSGAGSYEYLATATLTATAGEGYTFASWSDGVTDNPRTYQVKGDATLTANFTPKNYKLELIANKGIAKIHYRLTNAAAEWQDWQVVSETTTLAVPYGTDYEAYAETEPGYELTGRGSSRERPATGTIGKGGATFEPAPSALEYGVEAESSPSAGGRTSVSGNGKFKYGERAKVEANESTGYRFLRWEDSKTECIVSCEAVYRFDVTNDTYLTAIFSKGQYTVTFYVRDSNGNWEGLQQAVAYGEQAVEPSGEKKNQWTGHTFTRWESDAWKTVTRDLSIYALYDDNAYMIQFLGNGKTSGTMINQSFANGADFTITKCLYSREGYTFDGWCTDPSGTGTRYADEERVKDLAKASDGTPFETGTTVSLYAMWNPISYTIAFDGNGAGGTMKSQGVKYDEAYVLPTSEFSTNQALVCWTDSSGRSYAAGEKVSRLTTTAGETITLKAQWGAIGFIEYGAGSVDALPQKTHSQTFTQDLEFALLPNAFTRTGHTFAGWTNAADAVSSPRHYTDQQLVKNPCAIGETLKLGAVWQPIAYEVSFDANGGEGTRTPVTNTYGVASDVEGFKHAQAGYAFIGYDTNKNATAATYGTNATGKVTLPGNLTTIANDHIRLYAIWKMEVGEWSEALGCKNLKFEPDKSNTWAIMSDETSGSYVKYTHDSGDYSLDADLKANGTLTFEWRAETNQNSDVKKVWQLKVAVSEGTIGGSASTNCVTQYDTNLVWQTWQTVTCRVSGITDASTLSFTPDTGDTRPCSLRNVRWVPDEVPVVSHKVVFDPKTCVRVGGGALEQDVEDGHAALLPTVVGTNGCDFTGWEDAKGNPVDAESLRVVTEPITLYARYTPHNYRLIYEDTRDMNNEANRKTFTFADAITSFADLTNLAGEKAPRFLGWTPSTLPAGTTSNFVVRALWSSDEPPVYRVTFVTGADHSITNEVDVEEHKNAELPDPAPGAGWAFDGWSGSADDVTENRTNVAKYVAMKYPIVYKNLKGAGNTNPCNYDTTEEVVLGNLVPDPAGVCEAFLRWSPTNAIVRGSSGEKIFTAEWSYKTVVTNKITYVNLGGASNENNPTNFTPAERIIFKAPGAREGYDFAGWSPEGIELGTDHDVTATATWSVQKRTVTINGVSQEVDYGETVTYSTEASVTNGLTNVVCVGWVGTGDVPAAGTEPKVEFTVKNGGTVQWLYATNYWVRVEAKGEGEGGEKVKVEGEGEQWWASFEGGGVVLCDGARAVENPGWYRTGTNLTAVATPAEGWLFEKWQTPLSTSTSTSTSTSFTVTAPVALTAVFTQTVHRVVIDGVARDVVYGEKVTASVPASVTNGLTNVVCVGWVGTGDVPASGEANSVEFKVTQPSSLTWHYATNYWVRVEAKGEGEGGEKAKGEGEGEQWRASFEGGGVVLCDGARAVENPGWYRAGANLTAVATPAEGWLFEKWLAPPSTSPSTSTSTSFTVTAPVALTAVFAQKTHTVTFVLDECLERTGGGELVQSVAYGEAPAFPTLEGLPGWRLAGWYREDAAGGRVRIDPAAFRVTGDATIFALAEQARTEPCVCVGGRLVVDAGENMLAETNVTVGVYVEWPVELGGVTAKKITVSGLPSGLKFTAKDIVDRQTREVIVPANTIYGTPTAGGKTKRVKVTVTATDRTKLVGTLAVTVGALPSWLIATYVGGATNEPSGSATLTVAKTGKISGKWISEGLTWNMTAKGFVSCGDSCAVAAVTMKRGKLEETLTLVFNSDAAASYGQVEAYDVQGDFIFSARGANWKVSPWKAVAKSLKGGAFTTVAGDSAVLSGKVGSSASVKVAGVFDVGAAKAYTTSAKGTLEPLGDGRYELFVYFPPKASKSFAGYAARIEWQP